MKPTSMTALEMRSFIFGPARALAPRATAAA
jgi:hypothetical protein